MIRDSPMPFHEIPFRYFHVGGTGTMASCFNPDTYVQTMDHGRHVLRNSGLTESEASQETLYLLDRAFTHNWAEEKLAAEINALVLLHPTVTSPQVSPWVQFAPGFFDSAHGTSQSQYWPLARTAAEDPERAPFPRDRPFTGEDRMYLRRLLNAPPPRGAAYWYVQVGQWYVLRYNNRTNLQLEGFLVGILKFNIPQASWDRRLNVLYGARQKNLRHTLRTTPRPENCPSPQAWTATIKKYKVRLVANKVNLELERIVRKAIKRRWTQGYLDQQVDALYTRQGPAALETGAFDAFPS